MCRKECLVPWKITQNRVLSLSVAMVFMFGENLGKKPKPCKAWYYICSCSNIYIEDAVRVTQIKRGPLHYRKFKFVNSHSKVTVNRHTCIFMCKKFSKGLRESINCELVLKCLSLYFNFQIIYIMVVKISHRDSVYIRLIVK